MKTERDMFDEWYKSEYPLDYEHYVNEQDIGLFTKLYLRCFASWQASAQREGYAVVNKKKLAKVLNCVTDEWLIDTDAMNEFKEIELLVTDEVEAMIGAAP